jgi:hypothetical protein
LTAEDRLDIVDPIARYAYTLDSGDLGGYSTNPITLLTTQNVHDIDFLMHIGALGFTNTWLDM